MSHEYWCATGTPWTPAPLVELDCDRCTEPTDHGSLCEHGFCSRCCGCDGAAEAMFEGDR